jgi:hypothetical protein
MRSPEPHVVDRTPISRELSLLAFNRRVLTLAQDASIPLLERLRFLTIVASNLDEFFEIRVAGLMGHLRSKMAPPGMTMGELRATYSAITAEAHALVADQYACLNAKVLPALAEHGVRLLRRSELTPRSANGSRRRSATRCARCSRRSGSIPRTRSRRSATRASTSSSSCRAPTRSGARPRSRSSRRRACCRA